MMTTADRTIIVLALAMICLVFVAPLVTIWALNTLFPVLAIPYTFDTWLAMLLMGGVFNVFKVSFKK